jgi:nucleotide sugar dehydrogenase
MKKLVCVQGLGFVGSAMAVACAVAGTRNGNSPIFDVVGLDLPNKMGLERVDKINKGEFPFATNDFNLVEKVKQANFAGNLSATTKHEVLDQADFVVVDVHFDIGDLDGEGSLNFEPFKNAIKTIGERVRPGCLVLIETTVPPGTCLHVVRPLLSECEVKRGLPVGSIHLAHSYERVMPGTHYLASITDFWRVYSGETEKAGDLCREFLSNVVNVADYPLTRLSNPTASETAKVLENSYRAMNIAFMEEWGIFSENVGVDMFEVLDAIRFRPTHNNIKQPGFGVGGYCLTKDPLFAKLAAKDIFGLPGINFPLSSKAVTINQNMPLHSLGKVHKALGTLASKRIFLAGISYRQDVADTRYSPSEIFYKEAVAKGAMVICQDPLLTHWEGLEVDVSSELSVCPNNIDAVVFAVPHPEYLKFDPQAWLGEQRPYILDANNCLSKKQRNEFSTLGCVIESVGRG